MNLLRPFIRSLAQIPVVPGVHVHSIIAVNGNGPLEKEDDGVASSSFTRRPRRSGMRIDRWAACAMGLTLLFSLPGCGGGRATTAPTPVQVTDIASVAGKWAGLLQIAGSRDREDYVEVTVDGNGTYRATAARTIGVMDARGTFAVSSGVLVIKGESGGQGTAVLYTQPPPDQRLLVVNGTASDGRAYTLRLRPQR